MALTKIIVGHEDFDVNEQMAQIRAQNPSVGALVSFVGVVRDKNEGAAVSEMALEHYPGMTEKSLSRIVQTARKRWTIDDVVVIHRVGELCVGDQIVLTLVSSAHRQDAFFACEFIMDWLKSEAPFWKKESTKDGSRWVDARESDELAKARWGCDQ